MWQDGVVGRDGRDSRVGRMAELEGLTGMGRIAKGAIQEGLPHGRGPHLTQGGVLRCN